MMFERYTVSDLDIEKSIILGLIISTNFIKSIKDFCKVSLFQVPYARIVAGWCFDYYNKYSAAPENHIMEIFNYNINNGKVPEDIVELIDKFLSNLEIDNNFIDKNIKYHVDKASEYFRLRQVELLRDSLTDLCTKKLIDEAESVVGSFKRLSIASIDGIDVIHDDISFMFEDEEKLFRLRGALGELVGDICRQDFISIAAPMKRGKCLSGDSKIVLSDGRVETVENIILNQDKNVVSLNEKNLKLTTGKICKYWKNGKKPIYKIITRTGREIEITSNHPLYKFLEGWKSIDDGLKVGNYIAVPRNIPIFGDKELPENHIKLIAYLLAEGGLTGTSITFTKKEQNMKQDFINIIKELGDSYRVDDDLTISIIKGEKNYTPEKSKTKQLLMKYNMKFCKSIYKEIPDCIFTLPKNQLALFLRVLFSCDGTVYDYGVEYSSGSEKMIRQVQHLLLRFGIISKIKISKYNGRNYWNLIIKDTYNIEQFIKQIGFIFSKQEKVFSVLEKAKKMIQRCYLDGFPSVYRKIVFDKIKQSEKKHYCFKSIINHSNITSKITRNLLQKINKVLCDKDVDSLLNADIFFDEITDITYVGEKETFDISVSQYHNFIANDIIAHNTYWLQEIGLEAYWRGLNVLFYSLEMSEKKMLRRIFQYLLAETKQPCEVEIPYFDELNNIKIDKRKKKGLSDAMVSRKQKKLEKLLQSKFLLCTRPTGSINVGDIKIHLDNLQHYKNFIPDVIIIDYADIMASEKNSSREERHKLNDIWKALRGLAQERNCAVVTATQTNRSTFNKDIEEDDIAEDIRKLAHATTVIALNQSKEDKRNNIMRVKVLVARDDEFYTDDEVIVLECRKIGKCYIDSRWAKDVDIK